MPTYEYRCEACGHEMEEFQSITAKPLKKCPACGKAKLKRLIGTGAGVIFKGGGFYETDYRSESYKSAAKADSEGSKSTESKSESKKDAAAPASGDAAPKSEAKSESKPAEKPAAPAKSSEKPAGSNAGGKKKKSD